MHFCSSDLHLFGRPGGFCGQRLSCPGMQKPPPLPPIFCWSVLGQDTHTPPVPFGYECRLNANSYLSIRGAQEAAWALLEEIKNYSIAGRLPYMFAFFFLLLLFFAAVMSTEKSTAVQFQHNVTAKWKDYHNSLEIKQFSKHHQGCEFIWCIIWHRASREKTR